MEHVIKSQEIFPSADIRLLSDAELDLAVPAGAAGAALGVFIPLASFAIGFAIGTAIFR